MKKRSKKEICLQVNKITSYFSMSNADNSNKIKNVAIKKDYSMKKVINDDDDCIIIEETQHKLESKIEIEKSFDIPNESNNCFPNVSTPHKLESEIEIDKSFDVSINSNNGLPNELAQNKGGDIISSDDDEILSQSLTDYESQESRRSTQDFDDVTIFFNNMLEEFLHNDFLYYLFNTSDIELLKSFFEIPHISCKKIFARMYWLQWKWYKVFDIVNKYLNCDQKENNYSQEVIQILQENNLLLCGEDMNFEDWSVVLLRPDLIKACNHFKIDVTNSDKGMLIKRLKKFCDTKSNLFSNIKKEQKSMERVVLKWLKVEFGDCIKISEKAKKVFDSLHIISYLGLNPAIIREKKLNLLLMNMKNGKQSFPIVDIESNSFEFIFPSREYFENYVEAHNHYENVLKLTTSPPCNHHDVIAISRQCHSNFKQMYCDRDAWIPSIWLRRFSPGHCYIKAMELSINSFKAMKTSEHLREAIDILTTMCSQSNFRQHKIALWFNEQALIFHTRLKEFEKAAEILTMVLKRPDITIDAKAPLVDRAKRLALQKNISLRKETKKDLLELTEKFKEETELPYVEIFAKTTDDNQPGRKSKYFFRDVVTGERMFSNVEDYALLHYINNSTYNNGEHWEGRIITSIFILLFWDIIYCQVENVKGIYISKYQEAPLDFYTEEFYGNRKTLVDTRLSDIEVGWNSLDEIIEFMRDIFESRVEGELSLFHDSISWPQISEVSQCLGRSGLLCICKRLAMKYYYSGSGFPDLTLWNIKTQKVKFVEVKGDGDKLSYKQIQWMNHLLQHGVETEVCYVHKGSNLKKSPIKRRKTTQICSQDGEEKTTKRKRKINTKKDSSLEKSPVETTIEGIDGTTKNSNCYTSTCSQDGAEKTTKRKRKTNTKNDRVLEKSPVKITIEREDDITKKNRNSHTQICSQDKEEKTMTKRKRKINTKKDPVIEKSPVKSIMERVDDTPNKNSNSQTSPSKKSDNSQDDCYLRSPFKHSKGGVGYFVSPKKSPDRRKLSLTRRRIFEKDT